MRLRFELLCCAVISQVQHSLASAHCMPRDGTDVCVCALMLVSSDCCQMRCNTCEAEENLAHAKCE